MVDLRNHPVLTDIYNLVEGIEELGASPKLTELTTKATSILTAVNQLALELSELKKPSEEKRAVIGDWKPVADAVDYAYEKLGRTKDNGNISVPDWNLAVHVYQFTINQETKCLHCGNGMRWFEAYRCFDCKSSLCEVCAPIHFGPEHSKRAKLAHG